MTDGLSQGGRHAGVVWMEGNSHQCVKRGRRVNKHENASQCGLQTNSEEIVAVVPLLHCTLLNKRATAHNLY